MSTATRPNPFVEFRGIYYDRPVDFVREVLGGAPDEIQCEIMREVAAGTRRIAIRSGHRVGKTTVLAWLTIWWLCTRFPQKTVATAPTQDQLFGALAAETKTWMNRLPPLLRDCFEVQAEKIYLKAAPTESFVDYRTSRPDKPEAMAGVHSEHVLLIPDEASGIHEAVFESAIGSMASENAVMVMPGNPVRSSGYFYDAFHKAQSLWKKFHISCVGHPRVAKDFIDQVRLTYGEDSNPYRVRVLGEFPKAQDDTVIAFELVEAAKTRDVSPTFVREIWGVDVGRGGDASALARRKGNTLVCPVEVKNSNDTMIIVGWVKAKYDALPQPQRPTEILVDVNGLGAGVCDRLIELKLPARGINVSESPSIFDDRYERLRDELWFSGRDWFTKRDCRATDDDLAAELIAPTFDYTSSGKMKVESKKDMKKRGLPSPNRADAFLLTLAGDAVTAMGTDAVNKGWKTPLRRPGVMS